MGDLEALECGMYDLGWSNLPLLPALPALSRPWACHQSLAEGAQVVPAAREAPEGLVQGASG